MAGFVLLNQYSYIGENPDNVVAEFCVLPKYRKLHVAKRTFELLCGMYPGKWEIKYINKNVPAARLWNQVTEQYHPVVHSLEDDDRNLVLSDVDDIYDYRNNEECNKY